MLTDAGATLIRAHADGFALIATPTADRTDTECVTTTTVRPTPAARTASRPLRIRTPTSSIDSPPGARKDASSCHRLS